MIEYNNVVRFDSFRLIYYLQYKLRFNRDSFKTGRLIRKKNC